MDARKTKLGPDDLDAVFASARRVHVAKGKSVETFEVRGHLPPEVRERVLGRSGTLRAPTARRGTTFVVGHSDAAWDAFLT